MALLEKYAAELEGVRAENEGDRVSDAAELDIHEAAREGNLEAVRLACEYAQHKVHEQDKVSLPVALIENTTHSWAQP